MTKLVVLFNLKEGVDTQVYESWAKSTDLPTVNSLASVNKFEVFRVSGTLSGDASPYQYIEIIDVPDMDAFGKEISSETIQKVAAEFQAFSDAPIFILSELI